MAKKKRGFTLIELVVVIAILGILAGIAIPRFLDAQASAKGAKVLANLRSIDSAINLYSIKTGVLPTDMEQITTDAPEESKYLLTVAPGNYEGGEFIVKQNDGTEKPYADVSSGTAYEIASGRGVLGGNDRNVDYYLGTSGRKEYTFGSYTTFQEKLAAIGGADGKKSGDVNEVVSTAMSTEDAAIAKEILGISKFNNNTDTLYWYVNTHSNAETVYFASSQSNGNGGYGASLVVLGDTLYKSPNGINVSISSIYDGNRTTAQELMTWLTETQGFEVVGKVSSTGLSS